MLKRSDGVACLEGTSAPLPLPYELRVGVTGHCALDNPNEVEEAVRRTVGEHIVAVLEGAAAEPFGPHGSSRTATDASFRLLTASLHLLTRLLCPGIERVSSWVRTTVRALGLPGHGPHWHLPIVPHASSRPLFNHVTPLDLTVVTSLAPGSDQLVSRAVCECVRNPHQRNRYLEAVLPIPADRYASDLSDDEARATFRNCLELDQGREGTHPEPTVLHPDFPNCMDPEDPEQPLPRWKAFRDAGRHVVDSSEILIAIWDPERVSEDGGTEEITRYAVNKGRIVLWIDPSEPERGARRLLPARAEHSPLAVEVAPGLVATLPPKRAKDLSANFHRLAAFNRDAAWDPEIYGRMLDREHRRFAEAALASHVPTLALATIEHDVLPLFVRADQLANRYHELGNFVKSFIPAISAAAVTLIAFQILFFPHVYALAGVEVLLILVGYLSHRLSVHEAWHEKWLNDRHLAERLRDLVYTGLLAEGSTAEARGEGLSMGVNLLPFYRPTNEWFATTLARLTGRVARRHPEDFFPEQHVDSLREFVRCGWVAQQAEHHRARWAQTEAASRRSRRVSFATLAAILVVATAHGIGVGHQEASDVPRLPRLDLWIAFFTLCIPAWGAAFHAVDAMEDHPRMAERAARMVTLLQGVDDQLRRAARLDALRQLVRDARRIMELEGQEQAESLRKRVPDFHA